MTRILFYLRSNPLNIQEASAVPAEDAEAWVREMNEARPDCHYFTAE